MLNPISPHLKAMRGTERIRAFMGSCKDYFKGFFGGWGNTYRIRDIARKVFRLVALVKVLDPRPETLKLGYWDAPIKRAALKVLGSFIRNPRPQKGRNRAHWERPC